MTDQDRDTAYPLYRCGHRGGRYCPVCVLKGREEPLDCGWQPIETAPKDALQLVLWIPDRGIYGVVLGGWLPISKEWGYSDRDDTQPTHWMPLPDAPLVTAKEEDDAVSRLPGQG